MHEADHLLTTAAARNFGVTILLFFV